MAETAVKTTDKPESKAPPPRGRIAWGELGPRIVPLLAVSTGMLRGGAVLVLGDRSIVFIPGNLIDTIVRSIPFILAGLAVALGFKCGLFNIGAEGQLYA